MNVSRDRSNNPEAGAFFLALGGELQALLHPAPRRGLVSAWYGHVPFAIWLTNAIQPRTIVELGTHNGVSYAAFCEAVLQSGLRTRCFAIDTWQGDAQAGFYGEDVFRDLSAFNEARYSGFSTLLRTTFDEALTRFDDASVDLLHIDGCHSYEAVRHDWEQWLPKLSERGIVLFHDTNVHAAGFGVWQLWSELAKAYPHFAFLHAHGLGLLAVGKEIPEAVRSLCAAEEHGSTLAGNVRHFFSALGQRHIAEFRQASAEQEASSLRGNLEVLQPQAEEWRQGLLQSNATGDDLRQRLTSLQQTLVERDNRLQDLAAQRQAEVAEQQVRLDALQDLAAQRQAEIAEQQVRLNAVQAEATGLQTWLTEAINRAAEAESRLDLVLRSTSWRVTSPIRGLVIRHPRLWDSLRRVARRHPTAVRFAARMLRGVWRVATLRSPFPIVAAPSGPAESSLPTVPTLPSPAAGRAPQLWFFLGDTIDWLTEHSQLTGVGRVTTELFFASLRAGGTGAIPCALAVNPEGLARLAAHDCVAFLAARTGMQDLITLLLPPGRDARPPAVAFAPSQGDHVLFTGGVWTPGYAALFERLVAQGIRFSVLVYDIIPLENPEYVSNEHHAMFEAWLRTTLALADTIFVSSAENQDKLVRWAALSEVPVHARVVPVVFGLRKSSGLPEPQLPHASAVTQVRRGGYVLSVGTIDQRKNQAALCRIWSRLRALLPADRLPQLVLVGRDDIGLNKLSDEVAALIDANDILVLQEVADAELAALYDACLFTVFPSLGEGYGLPVAESLAHGKLCVASDLAVIRDHAGDLPWYVPSGDEAALLATLRRAIMDASARAAAEALITRTYNPSDWTETWRQMREAVLPPPSVAIRPSRTTLLPLRPDIPGVARVAVKETLSRAQKWCTGTTPDVSIVIVNWHASPLTLECIRQIWANTEGLRYEIIVVDNGSDPANRHVLRQLGRGVRLLELGVNRYFGEANNIAAEQAQGRYLCLLNNDAFVQPGCLQALVATLENNQQAGAAGPLFLFPDGTIQEAGGSIDARGYPVRAARGQALGSQKFSPDTVDYISAATLLVRTECFLQAGGFDSAYEPAYYEDVDFCLKLRALDRPVLFCPAARVIHIEGAAANEDPEAVARRNALGDINRNKFTGRWSVFLETRSEDALRQVAAQLRPVPACPAPVASARTAALFTPFPLTPGGGERVLLTIAAALSEDHATSIVTAHPYSRLRLQELGRELRIDLARCTLKTEAEFLAGPSPDLMITLANHIIPPIAARAKDSVFICQFPFPLDPQVIRATRSRVDGYRLIMAYSEYVRAHVLSGLSAHQLPPLPVEVAYPPVPQHAGNPGSKRRMVLTVGRFFVGGHSKRHDLMIDAFRRLLDRTGAPLEMHIAGSSVPDPGHMDYLARLQRQAADLPVTFHVNAPEKLLTQLYRDAALYWHAAGLGAELAEHSGAAEHFGITVAEAMSAGCVPMAFNAGGPREIITHGVNGILYATLDDLVAAAAELLAPGSEQRREAMGHAAMQRAAAFTPASFRNRIRTMLLDSASEEGIDVPDREYSAAES